MTLYRSRPKALRFAAAGAIAAFVLSGCAGGIHLSRADAPPSGEVAKSKRDSERNVARAEKSVVKDPQSAALRTQLGLAYLADGRFDSATTAFDDGIRLGDNSPRTALSLALAKIGAGHDREALAILEQQRDSIPVSDMGLALALAGDSTRGVALLADALRAGDNTPKLRQNLAYAYALDGRWREARTMMAQDVPADQVDDRISDWALRAKPQDYQQRVAGLLGAPVRSDPGQPAQLALAGSPAVERLAAQAASPAPTFLPASTELPAVAEAPMPAAAPAFAATAPEAVPVVQNIFATAFTAPSAAPRAAVPVQGRQRPARTVRVALPAAKPAAVAPQLVAKNGSHLVQLGSFSSPQSARRGWDLLVARNPNLRGHRMVITPAVVDGKNYWRVAAAGFDAGTAAGTCASVKSRGGACFAYAATRTPAGAQSALAHAGSGPALARRR